MKPAPELTDEEKMAQQAAAVVNANENAGVDGAPTEEDPGPGWRVGPQWEMPVTLSPVGIPRGRNGEIENLDLATNTAVPASNAGAAVGPIMPSAAFAEQEDNNVDNNLPGEVTQGNTLGLQQQVPNGYRWMTGMEASAHKKEREKQERRERNSLRVAAISDAIRALANQYYVQKGGLNAYNLDNTMFGTVDKWQKDAAERRRKNEESYFNRYIKKREAERKEYKDRADEEIKRAQLAIKEAQADQQAELNNLQMQLIQGKVDEQGAKTQEAQIRAKYADKIQQENLAILLARQGYWAAATGAQQSLANERDTRAANVGKEKTSSSKGGSSEGSSSEGSSASGGSSKTNKKGRKKIWETTANTQSSSTNKSYNSIY